MSDDSFLEPSRENDDDLEMVERYLDDDGDRHYTEDGEDVYSVTTILDKTSGRNYGLEKWREKNDGAGDNAYWMDLLAYKRNFGTLAHNAVLAPLEHPDDPEKAWTSDEAESLKEIDSLARSNSVLYSLFKDRGWVSNQEAFGQYLDMRSDRLHDVFEKDMDYVQNKFEEIADERGINKDTVTGVEEMFVVPDHDDMNGYGGQVDLLYEDPETGEHVVADLKTSKKVRKKHRLQVAAYAYAASNHPDLNGEEVDRCEIIRVSPEQQDYEVKTVDDWEKYFDDFAYKTRDV